MMTVTIRFVIRKLFSCLGLSSVISARLHFLNARRISTGPFLLAGAWLLRFLRSLHPLRLISPLD